MLRIDQIGEFARGNEIVIAKSSPDSARPPLPPPLEAPALHIQQQKPRLPLPSPYYPLQHLSLRNIPPHPEGSPLRFPPRFHSVRVNCSTSSAAAAERVYRTACVTVKNAFGLLEV